MKIFSCSLNVKLLREERLYCVRADFSKCKPSLNDTDFVYLPMGHIWTDLWEILCFLSPSCTKKYDCVSSKENWTLVFYEVTSCSINQSSSFWCAEIRTQKSLTLPLFLNFLNVSSNTAECSTRWLLDSQGSGDKAYHHLRM